VSRVTSLLLSACEWLEGTGWSTALHESTWVYPVLESVHVLGLCLFVGLAVFLDLRLLGFALRRVPTLEVVALLGPWIRAGFGVMVVSGALLFYSAPVSFYGNLFFRAKALMLVLAGVNAWRFHHRAARMDALAKAEGRVPGERLAGLVSLVLWTGVVASGRMIAYNWFK
jgi:hypothetical protein